MEASIQILVHILRADWSSIGFVQDNYKTYINNLYGNDMEWQWEQSSLYLAPQRSVL